MGNEELAARSDEIAGLGVLADRIGNETLASHHYLLTHGGLNDTLPGQILQRLAPFIDNLRDGTRSRHVHLADNCISLGDELNRAAWLYVEQDNKTYDILNAHIELLPIPLTDRGSSQRQAVGHIQDYVDPSDYGHPSGIDYPSPDTAADDVREALDEAAGWLGQIDRTIHELSGWSPLTEALAPITGNWNEISRVGRAYEIAGEAMAAAGTSLAAGVHRVDEHWNGMAAQAFADYVTRQIDGMEWEGPFGRTVARVADLITEQLRWAALTTVRTVVEMLEAEIALDSGRDALKFAINKIPIVGTAWQIERAVEIIWMTMELTMDMIAKIERVVDDFGRFIDAINNPGGFAGESIRDKLRPLNEAMDKGKMTVEGMKTADIRPVLNTPDEKFSAGTGDEPWRDA